MHSISIKSRLISLLRWSERYTNLDMVYFASGGFWQTFGQVATSLLGLGLVLFFANFLPKETYGTYRYILSLSGILSIFTLTGISQAVAQATAVGHEGALRTAVRYQLKWNLILMFVFLVAGAYYFINENFAYTGALLILGIATPFTNAFNTYGAYLDGKRQFRLNNIFSILSTLIYVGGMMAAVWWGGSVIWLITAYAIATLGANLLFYRITLKMFNPPMEPAEDTLRFGRHLTYIKLLAPLTAQIDSIILNHFWGPAALAVYAMATAIPNRAIPLTKDWVDIGFPKVARKTPEEIDQTFYKRIAQGLLAGSLLGGSWALTAPLFFTYFMPQYLDATPYAQLLGLLFVFSMPNRYITVLLNAQKMTKRIFLNTTTVNVLQLLLYGILGVWGGILGLITAQIAVAAIGLTINILTWRMGRA
ncbi:MAG: oligosaccharide flippase family protein [bacterium]|nr:oligosaccharide flippase family protein [bacterium]MDO8742379.1 oligosaccharide flippase family protein [bacterium]